MTCRPAPNIPHIMPAFDRSIRSTHITGTSDAARRRSHGQAGRGEERLHARMRGQKESLLIRPPPSAFPPNALLSQRQRQQIICFLPLCFACERNRERVHWFLP
jgi:hypothetical protein